jgi:hypothetical protein
MQVVDFCVTVTGHSSATIRNLHYVECLWIVLLDYLVTVI